MATVSADTICQSGVSYPQAIEIARQMNAGVGNVTQLVYNALPPESANELAKQINSKTWSGDLLVRAMWNPITAVIIAALGAASGGGGGGTAALKFNLASNSMYLLLLEDI